MPLSDFLNSGVVSCMFWGSNSRNRQTNPALYKSYPTMIAQMRVSCLNQSATVAAKCIKSVYQHAV